MTEAESGSQGRSPEFDFNLAEKQIHDITGAVTDSGESGSESSLASYGVYDFVDENRIPDSDPWNGEPNS